MKRLRTYLLLLVVVSLLLAACTSKPATQGNPPPGEPVSVGKGAVAKVNGKFVTEQEFVQRAKVYEIYYFDSFFDGEKDKENNRKVLNTLLDRYVNEVILADEAGKRGIKVTDQEAAAQVQQFNTVMANIYGGAEKLTQLKTAKNVTDADIQKALAASVMIDRLGEQLGSAIKVTDAEIQSYYTKNLATEFTVSEDQVRASHILVADEAKAKEIHSRIKNGEDFAKLAQEFSTDGSAARGGDLGYFGKGAMVKPFEDASFALKQVNDVSEPVQSQFGWHIIKLTGRRASGSIPLAEVKSSIEAQLKSEKIDAEIENLVKELRSKITFETVDFTKK